MQDKQPYKSYNTLIGVNKPLRFWGLSAMQFTTMALIGAVVVLFIVFLQLNLFITIIIVVSALFAFATIFSKLHRKYKLGNPDAIQSYRVKQATPSKILDDGTFNILIKDDNGN